MRRSSTIGLVTATKPRKKTQPAAHRPKMPGYGIAKSKAGLLPWAWASRALRRSHNYYLVSVRPGSAPHAMPVWGVWVNDCFYFSTGATSRKARNLANNPRCVVCSEDAANAVIMEGSARQVSDLALLRTLSGPYHRKYSPWRLDPKMGPIFEVRPHKIFGIIERTFPKTATRWLFESSSGRKRH